MKKKIIYISAFLLAIITIINPSVVKAEEKVKEITGGICNIEESIGRVNKNNTIIINGKETEIFCTFENQAIALENIKIESKSFLSKMKDNYRLEELSTKNWNQYFELLHNFTGVLYDEGKLTEDLGEEYRKLRRFFDIYENVYDNEEIKQYVEGAQKVRCHINLAEDEEFLSLLPNHSQLVKDHDENRVEPYANNGTYNATAAIKYAKDNAYNKSSSEYGYLTSDCTNFVSQVYNKGGLNQEKTNSTATGWWHSKNGNKHLHSRAWAYAYEFAKYWGVSLKTLDTNKFSSTIKPGDAILADWENDGRWDHAGVVTATSQTVKYIPGTTVGGSAIASGWYYDFQVAQHNREYLLWASDPGNNWDVIAIDSGAFGIARH